MCVSEITHIVQQSLFHVLVILHLAQSMLQPRFLGYALLNHLPTKLVFINREGESLYSGDVLAELTMAKLGKLANVRILKAR